MTVGTKSIPTTVLTDPILLGRDEVLVEVLARVRDGRHVLVVGEAGLGKSRLLREVYAIAQGQAFLLSPEVARRKRRLALDVPAGSFTPFYVREPAPMSSLTGEMMDHLAGLRRLAIPKQDAPGFVEPALWPAVCEERSRKDLLRLYRTARDRREAILHSLHHLHPPALVVLDSLDRAGPAMAAFLLALQKACTLVAAVREVRPSSALSTFFKTFGHVKVGKLPDTAMQALARYFIRRYHIQVTDPVHYTREVTSRAGGNPASLRALMHDGAQARLVTTDDVRSILSRDDAPYFNMGIVYVFGLIGGAFLRTFMTGTWDTDWYILLSVITILGFITFRVFRTFFTFYPTRTRA